jgi:hypothetical protein
MSKKRQRKFLLELDKELALPQMERAETLLMSTRIFFSVSDYWFQCKKSRN